MTATDQGAGMPGGGTRPSALVTALQVPRWALGFYRRHAAWVVGISLVPAAQRALSVLMGDRLPGGAGVALEMLTGACRFLLVALIVRSAILAEERLRTVSAAAGFARMVSFARRCWPSLAVQGALILGLTVVFDVIPERVIAPMVPAGAAPLYWAALLAVKNPTVIAFMMIWMVGAIRQMMLTPTPAELEGLAAAPPAR